MGLNISTLRGAYRDSDDSHDSWGSAMAAFFDVAHELHHREAEIPQSWGFRPSPMGGDLREDGIFALDCTTATEAELQDFGNVLERYTRMLRHAGRDY